MPETPRELPAERPAPAVVLPPSPASAAAPARGTGAEFTPFSDSRLVLLGIEPYWAFAYWDVEPEALEVARRHAGDPKAPTVIRFFETTSIDLDVDAAPSTFDIQIESLKGNYYVNLWSSGKSLVAEFGVRGENGTFVAIARSNLVHLPPDGEAQRYEDHRRKILAAPGSPWKLRVQAPSGPAESETQVAEAALSTSQEEEEEPVLKFATEWSAPRPPAVAAAAPGTSPEGMAPAAPGASGAPAAPALVPGDVARWEREAFPLPASLDQFGAQQGPPWLDAGPGGPDAGRTWPDAGRTWPDAGRAGVGISSWVSSWQRPPEEDRTQLQVKADLVVYGWAKPGTEVVIDGVPVSVKTDGTFDIRFALPPALPSRGRAGRGSRGTGEAPAQSESQGPEVKS